MTPERWYSIQEAADFLGISAVTLRRYIKNEKIGAYRIAGRYRFKEKALEEFIEACRLSPKKSDVFSHGERGNCGEISIDEQEGFQSIENLANTVILDASQQIRSLFVRAFTASRLSHYKEAESYYRQILQKRPKDSAAYFFLGLLYHEMKKRDMALQMWRQVVTIDKTSDLAEVARYYITRELRGK